MSRELLLLGLLRRWGTHGYQLTDFLEKRLAFLVDLKKPTAYALLERLRRDGRVTVKTEREGNRPERRVYQITPGGEAYFFRLLRENLRGFSPVRFPDAIGLYFLDTLPPDEAQSLLRERLAAIDRRLAEFRPKVMEHQGLAVQPVLEHYVVHLEADRGWLAGLLRRQEAGEGERLDPQKG
ncbi:MAG: PadR family transcriptional regulator [Dehalococcoidia bacterium]